MFLQIQFTKEQVKMWQLSVLLCLILTSICGAVPQQLPDARPYNAEGLTDQRIKRNSGPPSANVNSESFPNTDICGQRGGDGIARDAEFPWIVAISHPTVPDSPDLMARAHCLGSLIHPQAVLTEASCVRERTTNPESVVIRAGVWNISVDTMNLHQDRSIKKIIIEEEFNYYAILILSKPVELASNVGLVCLPLDGNTYKSTLCATNIAGTIAIDQRTREINAKKAKPPVIPHSTCQHSFDCPKAGPDECQLTVGAPLVCQALNKTSTYYQYGMVLESRIECNGYGGTQSYGLVILKRDWIEKTIADNSDLLNV